VTISFSYNILHHGASKLPSSTTGVFLTPLEAVSTIKRPTCRACDVSHINAGVAVVESNQILVQTELLQYLLIRGISKWMGRLQL